MACLVAGLLIWLVFCILSTEPEKRKRMLASKTMSFRLVAYNIFESAFFPQSILNSDFSPELILASERNPEKEKMKRIFEKVDRLIACLWHIIFHHNHFWNSYSKKAIPRRIDINFRINSRRVFKHSLRLMVFSSFCAVVWSVGRFTGSILEGHWIGLQLHFSPVWICYPAYSLCKVWTELKFFWLSPVSI